MSVNFGTDQLRLAVGCSALILGLCLATWSVCERLRHRTKREEPRKWKSLLGAGSAVAVAAGAPFIPSPAVTVPVSDLVAPAVAVSVLRRILETRRRQFANLRTCEPRHLDNKEMAVLSELVMQSQKNAPEEVPPLDAIDLPDRVNRLLDAVEEVREASSPTRAVNREDWMQIGRAHV